MLGPSWTIVLIILWALCLETRTFWSMRHFPAKHFLLEPKDHAPNPRTGTQEDPLTHTHEASLWRLPLCQASRCLSSFPQTDFISSRFIYFELLWHPILEPPDSTTLRGGKEAGCGASWDTALVWALISLGWKIQIHSKCVLENAQLPSPTSHCRGVGLCPFPLPESTELSTNRDFPLSAKQTAQRDLRLFKSRKGT